MVRLAAFIAGGLLAAVLGLWLIGLPWAATHPRREALVTTPAALGLRYDDVAFPARGDGLTIRGWWMPAVKAKAVLIYVHGANTNRRDSYAGGLEISNSLVRQGISVLALDMRNHGLSDRSAGGVLSIGVEESRDVLGAIDLAAARAPGLPIYLMGASMGGAAVIYAAASDPRVKRLVLLDPYLAPHDTSLNLLHAMAPAPRWMLEPVLWSSETFFIGAAARSDPLKAAKALELPILLIQDDGDHVCAPARARELAAANPRVRLLMSHDPPVAPGARWAGFAGHTAAFHEHPVEMERALAGFLADEPAGV